MSPSPSQDTKDTCPPSISVKVPAVSEEMLTLAQERALPAIFNIRDLTYFFEGGKAASKMKEGFMLDLERDPAWRVDDYPNLTLAQVRERTMAKGKIIVHFLQNEPPEVFRKRMAVIALVDPGFWTRLGVHYGLFFGAVEGQSTPEQFQYWITQGVLSMSGVIGCFGMTELGHGSNVAGLMTTATFDEASDEFIIHTPCLKATKWWIGGAAHTATHCAVYARLIVRGKSYGIRTFIVPLRSTTDFSLMPGVLIGDCGKKLGRDGIDNGYIQFTHVRIPRDYMLMRHIRVDRGGVVTQSKLPSQMAYGALIQGRAAMVVDSSNTAKKALTIAIRYAAIRRQGGGTSTSSSSSVITSHLSPNGRNDDQPLGEKETKLLDYKLHQYRLLPLLAQAIAMHFASVQMDTMYVRLMQEIRGENSKPGMEPTDPRVLTEMLKEAHSNSAGLKAFCTWNTLNIIEQCRQSLGGHGFSEYAGLAPMLKDWVVQCSWEGDNTILALQLGRYLVSCYRKVQSGRKAQSPGVAYLNNHEIFKNKRCPKDDDTLVDFEIFSEAFDVVAERSIANAASVFEAAFSKKKNETSAYEACAQPRFDAARIHVAGLLFKSFFDGVKAAPATLKNILMLVLSVYGCQSIIENATVFLEYDYFAPSHITIIRKHLHAKIKLLRAQAIHIVDSFNLTDYVVGSPLGRYDGNIYEHYFRRVSTLNPPYCEHPYFERLIKPILTKQPSLNQAKL